MRIMLVSETLLIGGAETFVVRLANALAANGNAVVVAVTHGEQIAPALASRLASSVKLESLNLPAKRLWWPVSRLLRLAGAGWSPLHDVQRRWLRSLIRRYRPQIVHSHLFNADLVASHARRDVEDPPAHVITLHGDYAPFLERQAEVAHAGFERHMDRLVGDADAIVGVCKAHLEFLRGRYPASRGKLALVYNGIEAAAPQDTVAPSLLPRDRFLFGMVSRGVEQKGWTEAIEAFRGLGREDVALVLVGEGDYIAELRRRGVPDGVILAGMSDDPASYIRHFDVCLLPTRFPHESLPTVVIEYLVEGKPVIATDVGEIREMLSTSDGRVAGRLLRFDGERIHVEQLVEFMREAIEDPGLRREMGEAARSAATRFDMGDCVRRYLAIYRRLASDSAAVGR